MVADRWYSDLVEPQLDRTHELLWQVTFLNALGLNDYQPDIRLLLSDLPTLPDALAGRRFFVVFPGAAWHGRQWPVERFAEVANKVEHTTDLTCVLCGGKAELHLSQTFRRLYAGSLVDLIGKTTLKQLSAIVKGAVFVMSNETSAIHISAAVGTPSLCILGGGHFGRFVPYPTVSDSHFSAPVPVFNKMDCFGCGWNCVFSVAEGEPTPCVERISTSDAWAALQPLVSALEAPVSQSNNLSP